MNEGNVTKRELRLIFEDTQKEKTTVTITMPKAEITREEVEAVSNVLIEKNVLCTRKGNPLGALKEVHIVMTKVATL